ncbi:MAG: glycosyltransferase family 39 protein [Candidatus Daviesbacteria bacterium]|nr:MAG: glycosyltransferase family 39 protein [Candidatus Daviesbacteria bacterium]
MRSKLDKLKKLIKQNPGFAIITFIYLATFFYMMPLKNQCFQDDWAYSQSVRNFLQTGNFKISEWSSASLIFQMLWGSLFAKIAGGFSLKILHLSTISIMYIGLIFFYLTLKRLISDETRAVIFTLSLLFFPWVFQFTYSFLTDVPYISLMFIALYFYIAALQTNKKILFLLGSLFAGFAYLIRQLGIVLPAAIFLTLIYQSLVNKKIKLMEIITALTPFLIISFLYNQWLTNGGITLSQYQSGFDQRFKISTAPYLLPIRLGFAGITNMVYAEFIKRGVFFFHHIIGYLFPIFFIFAINLKGIKNFFIHHHQPILMTTLIYLFFLMIENVFHFGRQEFSIGIPRLVTNWAHVGPIDWVNSWIYLVFISLIFFLPVMGATFKHLSNLLFAKRNKPAKSAFKTLIILLLLVFIVRIIQEFIAIFKPRVPQETSFLESIKIYFHATFTTAGGDIVYNNWIVFFILFLLSLIIIYSLTHLKFKTEGKTIDKAILFLWLAFFIQNCILIFFMYFYWGQYIIAIVPFIILWIAYFTRFWKINLMQAIIVICLMAIFSVSATKARYDDIGMQWEIGTQMVQKGIEPVSVFVGEESWLPWWYYEETLKQAVEQLGGDKFKLPMRSTWRVVKPNTLNSYGIMEVPLNFKPSDNPDLNIIVDSGIYYSGIFTQKRAIGYQSAPQK